ESSEFGAGVVAGAGEGRQFAQLLLALFRELVDARPLWRRGACALGLLDTAIQVGDVEKEALMLGAGVHISNLPAPVDIRRSDRSAGRAIDVRPGPVLADEPAAFLHRCLRAIFPVERLERHDPCGIERT